MQEQNNNEIKPIVPSIPSELPSHMEMFSDPIASLEISVTGGTFMIDPTSYLDAGYIAVESNGKWTVTAAQ